MRKDAKMSMNQPFYVIFNNMLEPDYESFVSLFELVCILKQFEEAMTLPINMRELN